MEIRVKKYDCVSSNLPRVHDPREVAARRRYEAARETDPRKREELLQSADEWSRAKKVWGKTDKNGKPVFTSRKDILEFQARTGQNFKFD